MQRLTEIQARVLEFIRTSIGNNQMPPTRAEIAGHFGFSVSNAQQHLRALEKKGRIRIKAGSARGVFVV